MVAQYGIHGNGIWFRGNLQHWQHGGNGSMKTLFAQRYFQFQFFRQWEALKSYANDQDIKIVGDIPIFVAYDSVDVWANPELYYLDKNFLPTQVAGVPPDYFSETGQLWGNPLYRLGCYGATQLRLVDQTL